MKKIFFSLLLLSSIKTIETIPNQISRRPEAKYFKLNSPFLTHLDGVHERMDGPAIGEVIQARKLIQDLQNGILENKLVNGKQKLEYIIFLGEKHTITELCSIEEKTLRQYNIEKDPSTRIALAGQIAELKECLKKVKHSFIQSTIKFMKRIEKAKPIVIKIMQESCRKRNIKPQDTIMEEWANTNGNEEAVFNDKIKNFPEFQKFLTQVYNFLGDFLKSLPKGFAQYQTLNKKS